MRGISEERLKEIHCDSRCELDLDTRLVIGSLLEIECKELNEWKPIETAPKDREIWLYNKYYKSVGKWNREHNDWLDSYNCFMDPTHWQELPSNPD